MCGISSSNKTLCGRVSKINISMILYLFLYRFGARYPELTASSTVLNQAAGLVVRL